MRTSSLLLGITVAAAVVVAADDHPADGVVAAAARAGQLVLLNPLQSGEEVLSTGGWRMEQTRAETVASPSPRIGQAVVRFSGVAAIPGGKGDYALASGFAGELLAAGLWVYLPEDANLQTLGFQVYDAEGEALFRRFPADWTGWRWLESDFAGDAYVQAYPQADKNGKLDQPLRSVHLFWFAAAAGPSQLMVNGLVGALPVQPAAAPLSMRLLGDNVVEPGAAPRLSVLLTNHGDQPLEGDLHASLQPAVQPSSVEAPAPAADLPLGAPAGRAVVPARSFALVPVAVAPPSGTGIQRLLLVLRCGDASQVVQHDLLVMPAELAELPADSPFGLNGSSFDLPEINRRLGIKWMRFENMKWQMFCDGAESFAFDGSIGPWNVKHDEYVRLYREQGIEILPYTFQTPKWSTSAPDGHKNARSFPPREDADYGEAMFQLAARYAGAKHPAERLKTADKLSGSGQISTFQLWNEPNLEGESWAPWVGSMAQYWELFRQGAEGVKRADPGARVSPAGFAGIGLAIVDQMRTHTYADGQRPLDFADLICVHYYSGRQDPEIAVDDPNANRTGKSEGDGPAFPERLRALVDWRDDYAPGKPIWITETGYDVGGPIGLGEREQAAKLPRVVMLMLAAGVEKVFIYREKGSTPAMHAGAGLMRNDGSLRPSWFTYATLIRQFVGVSTRTAVRIAHPDPAVWIHLWERDGQPLLTAWTIGAAVPLGLELGAATVVDAFGGQRRLAAGESPMLSEYPLYLADFALSPALQALAAQTRQAEADRQAERERERGRRAYLFDFGSTEYVGIQALGSVRSYTPVVAADLFDEERGHGFNQPALRDDVARWIRDPLEKDATRIHGGRQFIMRVEPGRYRLAVRASPLGERCTLSLLVDEQTILLPVAPDQPRAAVTVEIELDVRTPQLVVGADSYVNLHWLTLVEADPAVGGDEQP